MVAEELEAVGFVSCREHLQEEPTERPSATIFEMNVESYDDAAPHSIEARPRSPAHPRDHQGKALHRALKDQSGHSATALSDIQTAAAKKLAKLQISDNHNSATGRRFKSISPPPFSSRLSRTSCLSR